MEDNHSGVMDQLTVSLIRSQLVNNSVFIAAMKQAADGQVHISLREILNVTYDPNKCYLFDPYGVGKMWIW